MYEMLGLYEDSLVQYDELDALFTQFVLNHAAGGKLIVSLHFTLNAYSFSSNVTYCYTYHSINQSYLLMGPKQQSWPRWKEQLKGKIGAAVSI